MKQVRSIFLSNIHLGTRACQAGRLLDFLREHECDHLYLVGDIVDFWAMSRSVSWNAEQNTVVQKVLKRARHRVNVVYVPGNHDEALREHDGISLGIAGYWSLAGYAKRRVKTAVTFVFDFEASVVRYARERDFDGVICGHVHCAAIKEVDGLTFVNCGDWVDSSARPRATDPAEVVGL